MVRKSPIAGSWYEGTKENLSNQIHKLFTDEKFGVGFDPKIGKFPDDYTGKEGKFIGVVSPHAGYYFSGSIATHSYTRLYFEKPDLESVIIIGPNHRGFGASVSIYPDGSWETPMGQIQIDTNLIEYIRNWDFGSLNNKFELERDAHKYEHSIDIQIPFLQYLYDNKIKFIPICLADQSISVSITLSKLISELTTKFKDKSIAIIASSDMSHENHYNLLLKNDKKIIELITSNEFQKADKFRLDNRVTMCGPGGFNTLLKLAENSNHPQVDLLRYSNSYEIRPTHQGSYTVGYASLAVYG